MTTFALYEDGSMRKATMVPAPSPRKLRELARKRDGEEIYLLMADDHCDGRAEIALDLEEHRDLWVAACVSGNNYTLWVLPESGKEYELTVLMANSGADNFVIHDVAGGRWLRAWWD
jgi:hypothetical protein